MFVDHITVQAKAGDGGHGSAHFYRGKFKPKGGPDGGDGGKGGDIILEVSPHIDSLRDFFFKPNLKAKSGDGGQGNQRSGRSGGDLVLKVPAGTTVRRRKTSIDDEALDEALDGAEEGDSEEELEKDEDENEELELVADLTELGERFVLARGGKGGKGNVHFKNSRNQAPTETTLGEDGEGGEYFLELRKIADAGLVGLPNAGKSTLLGALSAAQPKTAPYPFTTLTPMVGVVEFEGFSRCTVADIPGLIEGAHANRGLGHEFLRHIMRCRVLLFVIDMAGSEGRDPVEDLMSLREEVSLYDELLAKKPWYIVANKMDLAEAEEFLARFKQRFEKVEVIAVSAQDGSGLDLLREKLAETIAKRPD